MSRLDEDYCTASTHTKTFRRSVLQGRWSFRGEKCVYTLQYLCYNTGMEKSPQAKRPARFAPPEKLMNKTFYRFFFSFVAVIAGTLLFILILGIGAEV
jgi:hypothetical protein